MSPQNLARLAIQNPNQKFNILAVITTGGRIVSIGHNDYKRKSYPWKKINKYKHDAGICAEMSAIKKWKNKKRGATISIIGFSKAGNLLQNTKPCEGCWNAIQSIPEISHACYYINGEWTKQRTR